MRIAIVDYNAGNTCSVVFALERLQDQLGIDAKLTAAPEEIMAAEGVIFPGVGAAGSAMRHLRAAGLDVLLPTLRQPVLGICLGMQLLFQSSEEDNTACLGIIPAQVERIHARIVPHTGWNQLSNLTGPLFAGLPELHNQYFVHSYAVPVGPYTLAVASHDGAFSAAVQQDNFYGVQFHPEKSGEDGQRILTNFLTLIQP